MARHLGLGAFVGAVALALLLAVSASAQEPPPGAMDDAPASAPREGWVEFMRQRTLWGVGFDESYHHNVFLQRGAQRQEDYETTLEAQVAFADPRGDWLYGGSYEVNAFRHHNLNQNGVHHEWRGYAHYTPLARYRLVLTEEYRIDDRLVVGLDEGDVIRRFAAITRSSKNALGVGATYDLNATNALKLQYDWTVFDDQATDDANVDSSTHKITVGVDHDLSRRWTIFGGYAFEDVAYPRAAAKDSQRHGIELGSKYDVDPVTTAQATVDLFQRTFAAGDSAMEWDLALTMARAVTPRDKWHVDLTRTTRPSSGGSAQTFTSNAVSLGLAHTLTPLLSLSWDGKYQHQATRTSRLDYWTASLGLAWQMRPNLVWTAKYSYDLYSQSNLSNHEVTVGMEAQL